MIHIYSILERGGMLFYSNYCLMSFSPEIYRYQFLSSVFNSSIYFVFDLLWDHPFNFRWIFVFSLRGVAEIVFATGCSNIIIFYQNKCFQNIFYIIFFDFQPLWNILSTVVHTTLNDYILITLVCFLSVSTFIHQCSAG